ncbi:oxidoreductase [Pseudonocardia thermophila]|uniref:oxidoreductase n=1 Tax=Pseudonocardia thermophila TaxID=1848 RepID=UPI00248E7A1B|nr:oxidoreductase [Pseudonocardia thermophila]
MAPPTTSDPLVPLLDLPGVRDAVAEVRSGLAELHNHPVNRRGWAATAAEAQIRAARASAALDGARLDTPVDDPITDPVLAGAVRAAEEIGKLLGTWRSAPLQALARLHLVAAADLVPDERRTGELGRPNASAEVSARLALLADLVAGGTRVPAPVLVAVVHGELLTLEPFPSANGVVARAAARLTAIVTGLDQKGLAVPEVGHLRNRSAYREAAAGFASGTPEGLTKWILHCCAQWGTGIREGHSIADARA